MKLLGGKVEMIVLCFMSFDSKLQDMLPPFVRRRQESRNGQAPKARGKVHHPQVKKVSGIGLLGDLMETNYSLVDAFKERKQASTGVFYHQSEFIFSSGVSPSQAVSSGEGEILAALYRFFGEYLWRVEIFLNPFFVKGEPVEGQFCLLAKLDGKRRCDAMEWRGAQKVQIAPSFLLSIHDGDLCFLEA